MLQSVSSVFVVYRRKTLTGSPDPTHANGMDKTLQIVCILKNKFTVKYFVTLPYLLSMYSTSSGRGFLPLVSWDQAVTSVYIVLTAACSIQG